MYDDAPDCHGAQEVVPDVHAPQTGVVGQSTCRRGAALTLGAWYS